MCRRLALLACLLLSAPALGVECFPPQHLYDQPQAIGIINGVPFLASLPPEDRDRAVDIAKHVGGCVEDYGVHIERMDPVTKIVSKWKQTPGVSVWRPVKRGPKQVTA